MEECIKLFILHAFIKCYCVPGIVLRIVVIFKLVKIPCFSSLTEIQDREYLFPALLLIL